MSEPLAFPTSIPMPYGSGMEYHHGMSLRDWFAGQALSAMLMNQERCRNIVKAHHSQDEAEHLLSLQAYRHADAMLAARKGGAA